MDRNRTLIDVLMHGNKELFHSSLIAWLLDPEAEHRMGRRFLEEFIHRLPDDSLARQILMRNSDIAIRTETKSRKGRYDIIIISGSNSVVIENKTKSIGNKLQLVRYTESNNAVIGLGFCDASFSPDTADDFSILKYQDILEILNGIEWPKNDWGVLITHYKMFLKRELSLIESMLACYSDGDKNQYGAILELLNSDLHSENDLRFLHFVLLEEFQRYLGHEPIWDGAQWALDKNGSSGVWLACYKNLPARYEFSKEIEEFASSTETQLWFHVELTAGMSAKGWNSRAGVLQLRCSSKNSPSHVRDSMRKVFTPNSGNHEYWSSRTRVSAKTFYLVRRDLAKEDLIFPHLEDLLRGFMCRFGRFTTGSGQR